MNKPKTLIEQMIEQNGGSSVIRDPMPGSYRMIDLNAPIPRFLVDVEARAMCSACNGFGFVKVLVTVGVSTRRCSWCYGTGLELPQTEEFPR